MSVVESTRTVWRWAAWTIVTLSVLWTGFMLVSDQSIAYRVDHLRWVGAGLIVTELLFVAGVVVVAAAVGASLWPVLRRSAHRWVLLAELAGGTVLLAATSLATWSLVVVGLVLVATLGDLCRRWYKQLLGQARGSRWFWLGFNLNLTGTVGTGVVAAVAIVMALPPAMWGALVLPVADIVASIVWRQAVRRKLRGPRVKIRLARLSDVPGIVAVDAERYGDITQAQTSDPTAMFTARLRNSPGWCWVAEASGQLVGFISFQSMRVDPDRFVSWDATTRNGTLEDVGPDGWPVSTYDPTSPTVYCLALTVTREGSRLRATPRLLSQAFGSCVARRKRAMYFAGRMPGYHRVAHRMSAEDYYERDGQVLYYRAMGLRPLRVVENGFAEDHESCGYSVLFVFDVPLYGRPLPWLWGWIFRHVATTPRRMSWIIHHFSRPQG